MLPLPGREEVVEEEDLPRQLPGQEEPAVVECGGSTRMTHLVGPVPVMVMSLLFIACVFMLHIWGKYNRA
jgi:hypothetical protein